MLQYILKLTSFSSLTCLAGGEDIIKYCLKFLSKNFWCYTTGIMAAVPLWNYQTFLMCMVHCITVVTQSI